MSQFPKKNISDFINKDLMQCFDISKGKIITLLKTVFSFLTDNSLFKKDSESSFEKYIIDNKFIQTMSRIFYFYSSNYPQNGKIALNELIKERYTKFLKYFEMNINYFLNSKDLQFRYYKIQGLILLWLIETKYDTEYYDDLIRLINSLKILDNENNNNENKYLKNFLIMILKFPFIKQNKETIINSLIVNECDDSIVNYFNENLNNNIQKNNTIFNEDLFNEQSNIGKKFIKTKNKESNFPLIKENSISSNKRKSYSNTNSQKGLLSLINSSGFYTPEFKHSKRDSIRPFRRFTINNINNPKTTIIAKNNNYSRANSMSDGMNNLLIKCEQGKHNPNPINLINNKISTKSKLRLAIQGHFYTDDDYKNNIELEKENSSSNFSLNSDNICADTRIDNSNNDYLNSIDICQNYISDDDNETENHIVSVDELPINPNISIRSSSTTKNLGIEPQNIIKETKEEEEMEENEEISKKINSITYNNNNNNHFKILTENEISDFFSQQFSDKKNKQKEYNNINNVNNNHENKNYKKINNSSNINSSIINSINNNLININKNSDFLGKERQNSKKNINFKSNIFEDKSKKRKNKSKEVYKISAQEKRKIYSNKNIFGMAKSHKNNKKGVGLKNKSENVILQPCTKGKESMNNSLSQQNGTENNISKEKLPTDSIAKRNLLSLYNQLKAKK